MPFLHGNTVQESNRLSLEVPCLEQSRTKPRSRAAKSRSRASRWLYPMLLNGGRDDSNRHRSQTPDPDTAESISSPVVGADFIIGRARGGAGPGWRVARRDALCVATACPVASGTSRSLRADHDPTSAINPERIVELVVVLGVFGVVRRRACAPPTVVLVPRARL